MPSRHGDAHAEYYNDEDYRPSRSPIAGHGSRREVEPYEYEAYSGQRTRRRHDYAPGHGDREVDYYRHDDRRPRRGRSLHSEERYAGRRRDHSHHRRQPRARSHSENRVKEAATAALAAGLAEAIKSRHSRDQSKRAITAAAGAAAVDALVSNGEDGKKGRHIAESAVSGLLIDRLANGSSRR
ncbi:hypothetical protein J3459_016955 [Metarhizium acridum]|uniref:Uncharacterized protein n=1 Tax=Metarhizium acridum (strain CQMa 102) TaxID=655827 RepID=E9EGP4_METAQ|nr:uncharacterized protein MAC_09042 [Metarhizium acridum CQMa 102]EFY84900.1 hypothetical protein MAC_09042 [Metarhizium acridum CQMa 102]KAG8410834.1 hypothetical protein J3459_016955 [Metarhizium acridum]